MILRLVALRLAAVLAVPACVLVVLGAVMGLDWCLSRCWPSLGPANGLVFSLSAPWGAVLFAFLLGQVGRLTERVPLPEGLNRMLTSC